MERNAAEAPAPPNVHNGTYTIDSPDGHYTVKLHTARNGQLAGKRILSLLTGPNNESDYRGIGFWDDDAKVVIVWKRYRSPAYRGPVDGRNWDRDWSKIEKKVAVWVDLVARGESSYWEGRGYRALLEGRCVVCNKKLTDPVSIETGIGPVCGGRS